MGKNRDPEVRIHHLHVSFNHNSKEALGVAAASNSKANIKRRSSLSGLGQVCM